MHFNAVNERTNVTKPARLRPLVAALCLGLSGLASAASFTLTGTGSTGGSASTGALNTASGSPCSLAGESLTCLSGTLNIVGLSGHYSFSASLAGLPTGSSWTFDPLSLSFTDPALAGGVSSVPALGGPALALLALLLAFTPVLRRRGVGKGRWTLVQTVASGTALSLVFAISPVDNLYAQPAPGSQTATASVGTAALRQLSLTLNANGTVSYTAYIRTGTPPMLGNVPDQSVTSGNAITPINLASQVTQTDGDPILGYRVVGSLPSGLSLVGATISGTPAASGSFSVQAQDRDGWSTADAVTITVSGPTLPATPGSLALVTDSGDSATDKLTNDGHVSWATVSGATSYEVSHNGTSWTDVGTATAYDFTSVLAQGSNTVYVRAKNGLGVSATPASLNLSFDSVPPSLTGEALPMGGINETGSGALTFSENISNTHSGYSFVYAIGQAPAGGSLSASATGNTVSFNYTTPNIAPGQDVQIKCVVTDEAGNAATLYTSNYTLY